VYDEGAIPLLLLLLLEVVGVLPCLDTETKMLSLSGCAVMKSAKEAAAPCERTATSSTH
jgi:hypothetical protein